MAVIVSTILAGIFIVLGFVYSIFRIPVVRRSLRARNRIKYVQLSDLKHIQNLSQYTIVGNCWSFHLCHSRALKPLYLKNNDTITINAKKRTVWCGSAATFAQLDKKLKNNNFTMKDRVQFGNITVGAGAKTHGHGFCTDVWMYDLIEGIRIYDFNTHEIVLCHKSVIFKDCFIVEVGFRIIPDYQVTVQQSDLRTATSDSTWYSSSHKLTMIYASQIIATWVNNDINKPASNQFYLTCCSHGRLHQIQGMFAFRIRNFVNRTKLSATHAFVRSLSPIEMCAIRCFSNHKQFEIFYHANEVNTDENAQYLQEFHREYGGRTEIRHRRSKNGFVIAIDAWIQHVKEYCIVLHRHFNVRQAALHTGKDVNIDMSPIQRIDASKLSIL